MAATELVPPMPPTPVSSLWSEAPAMHQQSCYALAFLGGEVSSWRFLGEGGTAGEVPTYSVLIFYFF